MARAASLDVTSISVAYRDRVIVRGGNLCRDFIGHVGFTEYFLILLLGRRPDPAMARMVDAALVAIAEHGLVPSAQAARMTLSAAPNALQGAVAAGLLGCGEVILGAAETAGRLLEDVVAAVRPDRPLKIEIAERLAAMRTAHSPLPGFGHPLHKPEDPRAWRLIEVARDLGVAGEYVDALIAIHAALAESYGRPLPLNVSGAIAATLLDAGFPLEALKGVPLVARAGGLVAHLLEEQSRPIGFRLAEAAAAAISYDGPEFPAPSDPM
jgi:citrate synthase